MTYRLTAAALLTTLFLGCESRGASRAPSDATESSTDTASAPEMCAAVGEPGCPESTDLAECRRVAIRHEYEMLEAHESGRTGLFDCHRDALFTTLDQACGRGSDEACKWAANVRRTVAKADAAASPPS